MATILVADDEPGIRELVCRTLEKQGHQMLETEDGPGTLTLLRQRPVDLLILDVMLPGMDGYEVQLQLCQEEKTKDIPVIILTALHPSKSLFTKFTQVKEFIAKPFEPELLAESVAHILKGLHKK